ncbi:MAG: KEOPS complex N(6)-L-threonylcarbamoyladenine synthase Kae1 [Candidatus Aenigmarchaeota archaeon]|nr:KEOPS complex N(6)-L-threonylcarbamoyladenine synthase Kae1 [Candidatus Aenigmarchaeota archaeon]MDI6722656.1 KEOPS complex N(6)-L-threonylcarbamoyladenine synthase Kae1 [Candidatus Aenigmarchaeota archaeon]
MISLGIESTSHTFGVGICNENKIMANSLDMYKPEKGWGIKPDEARRHHEMVKNEILEKALDEAKISTKDVDIISFSAGPGLPPCLVAGLEFTKFIAGKRPVIEVNHPVAHIEIGIMTCKCEDPVILYVSGGNTQVISYASGRYRVFGETQDMAIGNARDVLAREMGLGYPGGPEIDRLAASGKNYIEFPYSIKGMDISFTGILTEAKRKLAGHSKEDVAFSFAETTFAMLTEITERALAHLEKDEVLLTGGVAASPRLQEMMRIMCEERGAKCFVTPKNFSGDNGAMIAWTGLLGFKHGQKPAKNPDFRSRWRTDEAEIYWR